ncbi:hypothetical protein [Nocardia flavorosea]|uniref:Tetratricopeptide repeat protein n=1 Tax=Nocardia flavorosea TaxID=53429 RepID=A0A846YDV5_9NOCA|nr:hypothetical protein [Nocardia flavorosea]NKY54979.1 hypothetical protein [Nocardia flavorosea]
MVDTEFADSGRVFGNSLVPACPHEFAEALPLLLADAVWSIARRTDRSTADDVLAALDHWSGHPEVSRAAAALALRVSFDFEEFVALHRALTAAARTAWLSESSPWCVVESLHDRAEDAETEGACGLAADLLDLAIELCEGSAERDRAVTQLDELLPTLIVVLAQTTVAAHDAGRLARTTRAVLRQIDVLEARTGDEGDLPRKELAEAHRIAAEYTACTEGTEEAIGHSEASVLRYEELMAEEGPAVLGRLNFMWKSHIALLERFGEAAAAHKWERHRIGIVREMATGDLTRHSDLTRVLGVSARLELWAEAAALSARLVAATSAEVDSGRSSGLTAARRLRDHGNYLHRAGRPAEARAAWHRAVEVQARAAAGADNEMAVVTTGYRTIVSMAEKVGDPDAAVEFGAGLVAVRLCFADSDATAHLAAAVDELRAQAQRLRRAGRHADASDTAEQAVAAARELTELDAERYRPNLSWALTCATRMHMQSSRTDDAEQRAQQAVEVLDHLARDEPGRYQVSLANALHNRAIIYNRRRDHRAARGPLTRAVVLYEDAPGDENEASLANVLCTCSITDAALRRFEEALVAATRAERIYTRLAEQQPDTYLPDLAYALNRLASVYEDMADSGPVVPLATRVLEICEQLPEGPARDDTRASALHRMVRTLHRQGRPAEALTYSTLLVELRERMTAADPVGGRDDLIIALGNHAMCLSETGALREALAYSRRGVDLARRAMADDHRRYRRELAAALNRHAENLRADGAFDEAITVSFEAVGCYEVLLKENREWYAEAAARCFDHHAIQLGAVGRNEDAVLAGARGVELLEELVTGNPSLFGALLSGVLVNQEIRLARLDRIAEAVVCAERAVQLLDELTGGGRRDLVPDLLHVLYRYSASLARSGRHADAVAAQERAVRIAAAEAAGEPGRDGAALARATARLASRLVEAGRWEEGGERSRAAVRLWRAAAGNNPEHQLPELAAALGQHAEFCREHRDWLEAAEYSEQAAAVYERLSSRFAGDYRDEWALSVEYTAWAFESAGRHDSSSSAIDRALAIRRQAAAEAAGAGLPALAHSEGWAARLRISLDEQERAARHWEHSAALYEEAINAGRDDLVPALLDMHHRYANQLGRFGHRLEAVPAMAEAVRWALRLVAADRTRYLGRLAGALRDQTLTLGEAGRRQEALTVARAALSLGQEFATVDTGDRRRHIADGHDLMADSLAEVGRLTEALEHSVRAVSHWEELAAETGEPSEDLAWALWHRGRWLHELDPADDEILRLSHRAVDLYERICAEKSDRTRFLAGALVDHARHLASADKHRDALESSSRAVAIWETLAAAEPRRYRPELAVCLRGHSLHSVGLGHDDEALEYARRALRLTEEVVDLAPARFAPELAAACGVTAGLLAQRDPGAAIVLADRSSALYQKLADSEPAVFGPRSIRARHRAAGLRARSAAGEDDPRRSM